MKKLKSAISLVVLSALTIPQIAFAAPLTGADSDVIYMYKGMIGYEDATASTTNANDSDTPSDVHWPETDAKHGVIGHATNQFGTIVIDVSSAITGSPQNIDLRYWNGNSSTWDALTITSGAQALYSTGVQTITFDIPADWASTTLNDISGYWVSTGDLTGFGGGSTSGFASAQVSQISILLSGGGGGSPTVPEFSDYLLILLLGAGVWYTKNQIQSSSSKAV